MKWALSLVICCCVIFTKAQNCTTIKGIVVDKQTSEILPGAAVRLLKNQAVGTHSDAQGLFELMVTTNDTLLVSFIGYQEKRIALHSDCQIEISLDPAQTNLIEVVIKSERLIAEEFTIKKIMKLDIYTNPSAKADPLLAVNSTPSATTIDESANISLRGSSSAETGIFLNNVPINDAVRYSQLNGIGTFSIFNTALISNVQVYPGNPPLEFGNTTSGLIALQTEETIADKSFSTLSATMAGLGIYRQQKLNQKSTLTAFSNYQPSIVLKALNPKSLEDIKFNSIDLGVHYFRKISDQTIFKIFSYGIHESYQFHYQHPTYDGSFIQKKWRSFIVGNLRHRFKNSELSFNNGFNFSSANYQYSNAYISLQLKDYYTSFNYQYFGGKAEFKTGISYDYKSAAFDGKYPLYDYAIGEEYPTGSSQGTESVKAPEGYFYLKYFLAPKYTAGVGIRKNISINTKSYISNQINLNYRPNKQWNINLSAGRYHKYQLPQGENPVSQLIKSDQYSADLSYTKSKFESTFSAFYKHSSHPTITYKVQGLEFYSRFRVTRNLRTQVSLTCLDAQQTSEGIKSASPYDIGYFIRGNVEYKIAGTWTITAVFLFRQGSFYNPVTGATIDSTLNVYNPSYGSQQRLPSYNVIDMSISKIFLIRKKYSTIVFASMGNTVDFTNIRGYSYNFDYSQKNEELFSQRTIFFGIVTNF